MTAASEVVYAAIPAASLAGFRAWVRAAGLDGPAGADRWGVPVPGAPHLAHFQVAGTPADVELLVDRLAARVPGVAKPPGWAALTPAGKKAWLAAQRDALAAAGVGVAAAANTRSDRPDQGAALATAGVGRPLPDQVYTDLAAGREVVVPAGTYWLRRPVTDFGSGCLLVGGGAGVVLEVPAAAISGLSDYAPLSVASPRVGHPTGHFGYGRVTGQVTGGATASLAWSGGAWPDGGPHPGEVVALLAGVNAESYYCDPAENGDTFFMTVAANDGVTLTFTAVVPRSVPVWASYDAIRAAVAPHLWYKLGDYGADLSGVGGTRGRGRGYDHSVVRFVGGRPRSRVRIQNVTVRVTGFGAGNLADAPNNAFAFRSNMVDGLTYRAVGVDSFPGHVVHTAWDRGVTIDGVTVRGTGVFKSGGVLSQAYAVSQYFGDGLAAHDIDIAGVNWCAYAREGDPRDVTIDGVAIDATTSGLTIVSPPIQLNNSGLGRGTTLFKNWHFVSRNTLTTNQATSRDRCEGFVFKGGTADALQIPLYDFRGTLTHGTRAYSGPRQAVAARLTISAVGPGTYAVRPPAGLYHSARVRVVGAAAGVAQVKDGAGVNLLPTLAGGGWADLPADWYVVPGGDPAAAKAALDARAVVAVTFSAVGAVTLDAECEVYRLAGGPTAWRVVRL